ncbi:MAG TPA: tetratricopeptide repeat protein [Methylophilaceae bacterium]|jgi:predicted O-linked N-acetylglucosamine transferase (SPINDLY family)
MISDYSNTPVSAQARRYVQEGKLTEAIRFCQFELKAQPESAALWFWLASALHLLGNLEAALEGFSKSQSLHVTPLVLSAKASVLSQMQRYQESLDVAQAALDIAPDQPLLIANLAIALERLGKLEDALLQYERTLAIDPTQPAAIINKAAVLTALNRREEGLAQNYRAIELLPDIPDVYFNCASALVNLFRYQEALGICQQGLSLNPNHAALKFEKGLCLSVLEDFDQARLELAQAQILKPDIVASFLDRFSEQDLPAELNLEPRLIYLDARYQEQKRCFWAHRGRYVDYLNQWIAESDINLPVLGQREFGFQIFSLEITPAARLKIARQVSEQVLNTVWLAGVVPFKYPTTTRKRLRIAYLSPDFKKHPVGYLTRQVYALHDRQQFEIFCYSLFQAEPEDDVAIEIRQTCDVFRECHEMDSAAIARLIFDDNIDILIDLAGYTTHSKTEVLAMRPAPVQLAYLGYPGTMGADFIDYAIVDHSICPPAADVHWQEKLIRMPHAHCPYDSRISNTLIEPQRHAHGLPEGSFVFCSFNANYKIEPVIFSIWMRILSAVPNSVLWLVAGDPDIALNLKSAAEAMGVEAGRLIFAPIMPQAQHWPRYQLADLFLDTLWHNAHTTAADALWQGLPVLTCVGDAASSRLASSLLNALEVPELITQDVKQYEEMAIFYATHPAELKALQTKVQQARYSAPLFDTARTVRAIERAYQSIWRRYLARQQPTAIDISDEDSIEREHHFEPV